MRKEWKVYTFLGVMFVLYVIINYYAPKPLNWQPSFHPEDKSPYGGYVLFDRLPDLFEGDLVRSDKTLYELQDSSGQVILLAMQGNLFDADVKVLLERVASGGHVLLAAEQFSGELQDTLAFEARTPQLLRLPNATDTVDVQFGDQKARLSDVLVQSYFDLPDTTDWEVLASTDDPVLLSQDIGRGKLILSSTPLAFSNFGLLQDHRLAEFALTQMTDGVVQYSHYYQTGKVRSSSPFRYVLTQASLRWALYLSLLLIASLLLVDSQRRQRMVRVVVPLENSTVQFVKTIGALFFRERNNRKMAEKLARYFQEELYRKYHKAPTFTEKYYDWLSHKTGCSKTDVVKTFQVIESLPNKRQMSDEELKALNDQVAAFSS